MQNNSYRDKKRLTASKLISEIKMQFRCFAAVTMRCLCPYEKKVQEGLSKNGRKIINAVMHFILSFILGFSRLNFGISPFGLSIVCTIGKSAAVYSFCGAAAACLFDGIRGVITFISYFLVFLIRKSITNGDFNEKLTYRLIICALSSGFIGACTILSEGFGIDNILLYAAYIFLSVSGVYLFSALLNKEKNEFSNGVHLLSIYSVIVCMMPAFNRVSFSGVDLGLIFACFSTLLFSKAKGPVYGCVAGFVFGFSCLNPLCSAPIGISGLISGYLFTLKTSSSLIVFPLSSFFVYIYLFGLKDFLLFMPFVLSGTILYAAFYKSIPDIFSCQSTHCVTSKPAVYKKKNDEFEKVSDSLSGLSAILYKFAEHLKAPGSAETGYIIDSAFNDECMKCSMNTMCYAKRECNMPAVKKQIISSLHSKQMNEEELSALLLGKCIKTKELCNYINRHYSELYFVTMKSNRTQTVAGLYNSMSRLIRNTSQHETEKNKRDEKLEKKISEALEKIGVEFSYVTANGTRCKDILVHGVRTDKIPCSAKELSCYLSSESKLSISEPEFDISDSADIVMKLTRTNNLSIDYAQFCEAKCKGNVNGDSVSFFESDKGYFYALIADGMGSGKTAAATSRLSCVFLEKMLSAGTAKNVCIELLNNLLLSKNDETFSGIDLLEIDKLNSSACFIKAGAAPSFILRGGRLYKICSETPPVGIIPSFSAESTRFSLEKGDIIIMASDGIIMSDSDAVWISELIMSDNHKEPAFLASSLVRKARSINERRDDASACVIRID